MNNTLYFYDLETSGIKPATARIMQFAGQRTDLNLKPIGEPDNIIIKLSDDVLPDPDAILVTGITPQKSRAEGITEAEFLRYFYDNISTPNTIFVGYNNIRFDDEFIRYLNYRNFYDAYEWSWKDNRSRWDLLDIIRMTRALRPDGIEWPFGTDGRPSNKLELLTSVNNLEHTNAHDALSDVNATIAMARLIRNKNPKLFDFLLNIRGKHEVKKLIDSNQIFLYTSGRYASVYQKTTAVTILGENPGKQGLLVYDLRIDPETLRALPPVELAKLWREWPEDETKRFPVKTLQLNKCPAIAPLSVLDKSSQERIKLDIELVKTNLNKLKDHPDLYDRLVAAAKIIDKEFQGTLLANELDVDRQLYEGFFSDQDKTLMSVVRAAEEGDVAGLDMEFTDDRLNKLLPLYKARNFINVLSTEEREEWEKFRYQKIMGGGQSSMANKYFSRISELVQKETSKETSKEKLYLLEELQLYGQSIIPEPR